MKKKTGVDRRQFLKKTSVAMGIAAISGGTLSAEDTESRKATGTKTESREIFHPLGARDRSGPLRSYAGAAAAEVAFPLGGIGTGTVSLGGRGELRDWEIFKRPAKRRILPFTFAALWVKPEGASPLLRVVEGQIQPPFTGWNGFSRESGQGLRHFQKATLTGKYPIATVEFEDHALPVSVSLDAFTPFVPLNVDD